MGEKKSNKEWAEGREKKKRGHIFNLILGPGNEGGHSTTAWQALLWHWILIKHTSFYKHNFLFQGLVLVGLGFLSDSFQECCKPTNWLFNHFFLLSSRRVGEGCWQLLCCWAKPIYAKTDLFISSPPPSSPNILLSQIFNKAEKQWCKRTEPQYDHMHTTPSCWILQNSS